MTWQHGIARRAINDWRDMHQLRAAALVNDAAVAALAAFERHIPEYDALEAWRTPDAVAADFMRPVLGANIAGAAAALMEDATTALTKIDPRFASLSEQWPKPIPAARLEPVATAASDRPPTRQVPIGPPAALPSVLHSVFARSSAFAEQATQAGRELANAMVTRTREIIGLHALLRDAALKEVQRHWTGPASGDDLPYRTRVDATIDALADRARAILMGQTG